MAGRPAGFRDVEHGLWQFSERGDPLEKLAATVDFEIVAREQRGGVMGRGVGLRAAVG